MDAQTKTATEGVHVQYASDGAKRYISLPPEDFPDPEPFFSAKFVAFTILVLGSAALGGAIQSGRISPGRFFHLHKSTPQLQAAATPNAPAFQATVPAPSPGAFVVTTISIGDPSFAIINGTSHMVGDAVEAPGVTGWKVHQIVDGAVILQNGSTQVTIPQSMPGLKPLDDSLKPLN